MLQSNSAMRQELEVQKTEVEAAQQSLAEAVSTRSKALQVSWHHIIDTHTDLPLIMASTMHILTVSLVCAIGLASVRMQKLVFTLQRNLTAVKEAKTEAVKVSLYFCCGSCC